FDEAERRLELAPHGEQLWCFLEAGGKADRRRGEAAGAPQGACTAAHDANYRIVDPAGDHTLMGERVSGNGTEPLAQIPIVDHLRLVGKIAACHDHGTAKSA